MTTWIRRLVDGYPDLFNMDVSGAIVRPGWPTCGDGWADIVERTVKRIADAVANAPAARLTITQIKEKFGTLRLH